MLIQPGGIVPCLITSSMAMSITGRTLETVSPNLSLLDSRSGRIRRTLNGIRRLWAMADAYEEGDFCCEGNDLVDAGWLPLISLCKCEELGPSAAMEGRRRSRPARSRLAAGSQQRHHRLLPDGFCLLPGLPFPLFGTRRAQWAKSHLWLLPELLLPPSSLIVVEVVASAKLISITFLWQLVPLLLLLLPLGCRTASNVCNGTGLEEAETAVGEDGDDEEWKASK
jgi:hypothetical protein